MAAAVVRDLASRGACVLSLDLDAKLGEDVAVQAAADFRRCDVTDEVSVQDAFAAADSLFGGVDALVHAAGIAPAAAAEEIDLTAWERAFAVNARGTFLTNRAAFLLMRERGGRIINFASSAGAVGYAGKAHYAASKGAVLAWTRTVAKEWGRYGINVNALAPAIATPMYATTRAMLTEQQLAELDARLRSDMPIDGKLGDAERDLAPVVRFLVSEDSRFVTGQTIAVDGGLMMVR
jgi:NAD(P)-dependent dehydrogenase (short-subunit alcohol dehydrogenase family)